MVYQKRYIAYAKNYGKTPDEMIAYDKKRLPGGWMAEFIIWIHIKVDEFRKRSPHSFCAGRLVDHDAFTKFLFTGDKINERRGE